MQHITIFNPTLDLIKAELVQSKNIKDKNTRKEILKILNQIYN